MDKNISIIQLIQKGDIDINIEISNLQAGRDINIYIRKFLEKSSDYKNIKAEIQKTEEALHRAVWEEKQFYADKLEKLRKIEQDFITNTLLLAETFSKMELRTEKLRKAKQLFEQGKINEADKILDEKDLRNDQHNLITYLEYLEKRKKILKNDISTNN